MLNFGCAKINGSEIFQNNSKCANLEYIKKRSILNARKLMGAKFRGLRENKWREN